MAEEFDAAVLVEEMAERLAEPKSTGPKYISVAPLLNRATRRRLAKMQRARQAKFEGWKRDLTRAGIDWEAVLREREAKLQAKLAEEQEEAA